MYTCIINSDIGLVMNLYFHYFGAIFMVFTFKEEEEDDSSHVDVTHLAKGPKLANGPGLLSLTAKILSITPILPILAASNNSCSLPMINPNNRKHYSIQDRDNFTQLS